jgi:hypothetical protein
MIFDQPHIFIVFNPGSGGNFIAGLINELSNSMLRGLPISEVGSSHTVLRDKTEGTDYLSFGTLMEEHDCFLNEEARESFYVENIKATYSENCTPEIVWTHDFTNIPLYRKYFKNSSILVITNNTTDEKLISLFMLVKKTILNKNVQAPMSQGMWEYIIARWKATCLPHLLSLTSLENANKMLSDRLNPDYADILCYATMRLTTTFFNMLHLVEDVPKQEILFDRVIYPMRFRFGAKLDSYIDDKCTILPYSYLSSNDFNLLTQCISSVLNRKINDDEIKYVNTTFETYRSSQNQLMLSNPVEYFNQLKQTVLNI